MTETPPPPPQVSPAPAAGTNPDPATPAASSRTPRLVAAGIVFGITAPLYLATMARTIGFIDRGELAAVAATLGITHPTGYPTLTLLAHAVTRLAPRQPVVALDAFAALLVALGAAGMVLVFDRLLRGMPRAAATAARPVDRRARKERARDGVRDHRSADAAPPDPAAARRAAADARPMPALSPWLHATLAALAALLIATGETYWQQANGFEVYPFQSFLVPILMLAFIADLEHGTTRSGLGFGLALGITFTNHLTALMLAPAFLVAWFARFKGRGLPRLFWPVAPAFAIGLLPYLYLPLRSRMMPRLDWGHPADLAGLIAHVSGRQYRLWMFSNLADSKQQLAYILSRIPSDLAYAGLLLVAAGIAFLWRRDRHALAFALLMVAASLTFVAGYGIRDIDPYALVAFIGLGALAAAGLAWVAGRHTTRAAVAAGAILVIANLALHYRSSDESRFTGVATLTHDLLDPLPPHAILCSSLWDHVVSPAIYFQNVAGVRPDVTVINTELLAFPWYVRQLAQREPALMQPAAAEAHRLVGTIESAGPGVLSETDVHNLRDALLGAMVNHAIPGRHVFTTVEIDPTPFKGRWRAPWGLVTEIRADSTYLAWLPRSYRIPPDYPRVDLWIATLHLIYGQSLEERAIYEREHGHADRADAIERAAVALAPPFGVKDVPVLPVEGGMLARQSVQFFEDLRVALVSRRAAGAPPSAR